MCPNLKPKRKNYIILGFGIFLLVGGLLGKSPLSLDKLIPFPGSFQSRNFAPDKIAVGGSGNIYLLDKSSRQIAVLTADGDVRFAGGFGNTQDAFFDPIGLSVYNLDVWVADRSENRFIVYDSRLNFIRVEEHDRFYPELMAVDPWGNIFVYSSLTHSILRKSQSGWDSLPFIDLNTQTSISDCIEDMGISSDGEIGLLDTCEHNAILFNRLGRLIFTYPVAVADARYLVPANASWLAINKQGNGQELPGGDAFQLETETEILDIGYWKDRVYVLTFRQIFVLRVHDQ